MPEPNPTAIHPNGQHNHVTSQSEPHSQRDGSSGMSNDNPPAYDFITRPNGAQQSSNLLGALFKRLSVAENDSQVTEKMLLEAYEAGKRDALGR